MKKIMISILILVAPVLLVHFVIKYIDLKNESINIKKQLEVVSTRISNLDTKLTDRIVLLEEINYDKIDVNKYIEKNDIYPLSFIFLQSKNKIIIRQEKNTDFYQEGDIRYILVDTKNNIVMMKIPDCMDYYDMVNYLFTEDFNYLTCKVGTN